jgi:polyhydroxyalkanoate synthesis regulator phasin
MKDMPPRVAEAHMVLQETKVRLWRLAELVRTARSKKTKSRLTERIRQDMERQFDAEGVVMQYRLEHLRQDIDRIEKKLKDRSERRGQLINDRVEQILNPTTQPTAQGKPDKDPQPR